MTKIQAEILPLNVEIIYRYHGKFMSFDPEQTCRNRDLQCDTNCRSQTITSKIRYNKQTRTVSQLQCVDCYLTKGHLQKHFIHVYNNSKKDTKK